MFCKKLLAAFFVGMLTLMTVACEQEGPMEETGEQVDETMEQTGEAMEETGEQAGETMEETGEEAGEQFQR